jgi:hypothetical protein
MANGINGFFLSTNVDGSNNIVNWDDVLNNDVIIGDNGANSIYYSDANIDLSNNSINSTNTITPTKFSNLDTNDEFKNQCANYFKHPDVTTFILNRINSVHLTQFTRLTNFSGNIDSALADLMPKIKSVNDTYGDKINPNSKIVFKFQYNHNDDTNTDIIVAYKFTITE